MSQHRSNGPIERWGCMGAHKKGAIVERDRQRAVRRIPDVIWVPAPYRSRANVWATSVHALGIDGASSIDRRQWNVWDLPGSDGRVQSIDPLLRKVGRVRRAVRETCRPLWAANRNVGDAVGGVASVLPPEEALRWVSCILVPPSGQRALDRVLQIVWVGSWMSKREEGEEQEGREGGEDHGGRLGRGGGKRGTTETNFPRSRLLAIPPALLPTST
jgi:hypothetical protein